MAPNVSDGDPAPYSNKSHITRGVGKQSSGFFKGATNTNASNSQFTDITGNVTNTQNGDVTNTHNGDVMSIYNGDVTNIYNNLPSKTTEALAKLKPIDRTGHYVPPCMPGTRGYIFEEIEKWLDDVDEPNILWLSGSPGAGKSTVASSMVSRLSDSKRLGACFFFKQGNAILSDPSPLWRTVSYDIARRNHKFAHALVKPLTEGKVDPEWSDINSHFTYLIKNPLEECYGQSTSPIIIIDALDECDSDSAHEAQREILLDTLVQWSHLPKTFKIIITGRDDRVPASFRAVCKKLVLRTGSDADKKVDKDIRLFLETSFNKLPDSTFKRRPRQQTLDDLTARAEGLFIWAETAKRLLEHGLPMEQLKRISDGDLREGEKMNKLYEQVLATAFRDPKGRTIEVAKLTLSAIVLAKVPFHTNELHLFVSEDESSVAFVLNKLSSVISIGAEDKSIQIWHLSFSEFLCDPNRCPEKFYIDRDKMSGDVAMSCFHHMKKELKFNICGIETSYLRNDEVKGLSNRIENAISGPLLYSCRYWGGHLRDTVATPLAHNDLLKEVKDFFDYRLLFWLEVMSLVKEVSVANAVLLTVIPWIKKSDTNLSAFARDASRFIVNFDVPISQSVPHIYLSALPFSPAQSLIAQQYKQQVPKTLSVVSGRDQKWPAITNICRGHTDEINSVAFSKDGKWVVSGSDDETIRIWHAETGQPAADPFKGHTKAVTSVAFSPDSSQVVSGSWDRTVRVWDVETGKVVAGPFNGHQGYINSVAFSPDGRKVVSGSEDKTIRIWYVKMDQSVADSFRGPFTGHEDRVNSVAFSPNGWHLVSGSDDKTVRIWDAGTGDQTEIFKGHTDVVTSVAFSQDAQRVVSGSSDGTIRIWHIGTGEGDICSFEDCVDAITCVAFSLCGNRVVLGSSDDAIRIWDLEKGQAVVGPFKGHSDWIGSVAFSPDDKQVVSGSYDKTIRIWDAETDSLAAVPFEGHMDAVTSVALSLDDKRIVVGSNGNVIHTWDVRTGQLAASLSGHTDSVNSVAISQDGKRIVSGSNDNTIRLWNSKTGQPCARPLQGHKSHINSIAISQDGKWVVSGSDDNTIRVWDIKKGPVSAKVFNGHTDGVRSVAFSPKGRYFVSGSDDKTIRIWNVENPLILTPPFEGHKSVVASVAYSPDGDRIVSGSWDRTVCIWDVKTRQLFASPFEGHTKWVRSVAFSRDGKRVVSGSDDRTVRIWNVDDNEHAAGIFYGHTHNVTSVAFLPDGKRVISGSSDGTVRVWDIGDRQTLHLYGLEADYFKETGWLRRQVRDSNKGQADEDQIANVGKESVLSFWVPQSYRKGLCSSETSVIFGTRITKVDFSQFRDGKSWTRCYSGSITPVVIPTYPAGRGPAGSASPPSAGTWARVRQIMKIGDLKQK